MPSTVSVLAKLRVNYPQFSFKLGDYFLWSSSDNTIYYDDNAKNRSIFLLHELSHALLGHINYARDIELIAMERQAWDNAIKLAPEYDLIIPDQIVETTLDSYRDWIHARSKCPRCEATGVQTEKYVYICPSCSHRWQVNEARTCSLRRYEIKIKQKTHD